MQASPAGITILEGARFLVADGIGNVSGGLEGFYADDTRQLSRWRMTLDGRAPMLLASGTGDYASATIYLRHDSGTPSRPSEIGAIRRLFTSAGALHERLTLENYGSRPCEVVVRYEFDADFLDIFEVKLQSYGERDLAFAKSITPLHTSRWYDDADGSFRFAASGGGFEASSLVAFDQKGVPGDREMHFEVQLAGRATWSLSAQVTVLQPAEERPQPEALQRVLSGCASASRVIPPPVVAACADGRDDAGAPCRCIPHVARGSRRSAHARTRQ